MNKKALGALKCPLQKYSATQQERKKEKKENNCPKKGRKNSFMMPASSHPQVGIAYCQWGTSSYKEFLSPKKGEQGEQPASPAFGAIIQRTHFSFSFTVIGKAETYRDI